MRKCRLRQHQLPHPACVPKRSPPRQALFCASHDGGEGARAWKVYGGRVVAISRPSSRLDDDSVCWWRYELAGDEAPPPSFPCSMVNGGSGYGSGASAQHRQRRPHAADAMQLSSVVVPGSPCPSLPHGSHPPIRPPICRCGCAGLPFFSSLSFLVVSSSHPRFGLFTSL